MKRKIAIIALALAGLTLLGACVPVESRGSVDRVGQLNFVGSEMDPVINMGQLGNRIDFDANNDTSIRASADNTLDIEINGADEFQLTAGLLLIGDASAGDDAIVFDGNAQDYYVALYDTTDDLVIGLGATVGTTPALAVDENQNVTFSKDILLAAGMELIPSTATNSGLVFALEGSFAFGDTTNVTIGVIPANANVVDFHLEVVTIGSGGDADETFQCGTTVGDANEFINDDDADATSAGLYRAGVDATYVATGLDDVGGADVTVYCKVDNGAGGTLTAGAWNFTLLYAVD